MKLEGGSRKSWDNTGIFSDVQDPLVCGSEPLACVRACVHACVCVCVWVYHLDRCKISYYCRWPLGNIAVSGQRRRCNVPVKTYLQIYIYIYICMYVCLYVCMYACLHACMYVKPLGASKSQLRGHIFHRCFCLPSTSTVIIFTYI